MVEKAREATRRVTLSCQFCLTLNRVDVGKVNHSPKCGSCGKPILLDRPIRVTDDDFQHVIGKSEIPVMVDFYADWCAPCKIMAPVLDEFAHQHIGEILVVKLDTDRNPDTAEKYGIRGIPTMIVFRKGVEVARRTGAVPRDELEKLLAAA